MFIGGRIIMNLIVPTAGIRIFHAATIAQPVDIYLNDKPVIRALNYKQATDYLPLPKGKYNVKIYTTTNNKLLYNETINVDGNKFITLSAISESGKLNLIVVEDILISKRNFSLVPNGNHSSYYSDYPYFYTRAQSIDNTPINNLVNAEEDLPSIIPKMERQVTKTAQVKFVHLSPNAPAVDITTSDGAKLFVNTKYKEATDYIHVGGTYNLQVRPTGSNDIVLSIPNLTFNPHEAYSIYVIGLLNGTPKLEAIILKDRVIL